MRLDMVYVVRSNTDGAIEAVFTSEELAKEYGNKNMDTFWGFYVEPWRLDPQA